MNPAQFLRVYGIRWYEGYFKCRKKHHYIDTCYNKAFTCVDKINDI